MDISDQRRRELTESQTTHNSRRLQNHSGRFAAIEQALARLRRQWAVTLAICAITILLGLLIAGALRPCPPVVAPVGDGNLTPGGQYRAPWNR